MQIYAPSEKKPFVSIAGEWSGLMEAKWHDKNVIFALLHLYNRSLFKLFFFCNFQYVCVILLIEICIAKHFLITPNFSLNVYN